MNTILLEPRKALNKAFLKIKPNRTHIEEFKTNLIKILDSINEKESEEFHKNLVIDFLKKTYYDLNYSVNTKGRNDLVIHNGKDAKSNVGVIMEAKSPINKTEMITVANLNGKALQELVLYYMRERITHKNTELKHLVVTNIHEWFVFDAQLFNKLFADNKPFTKQFVDFEEGRLSGKTTDYFYKEIAKPFIEGLQITIEFAHFDIRKYDKPLRNEDKEDDKKLVALFKLLSPEHLLKLSFANDSNTLDKNFYSELLHIIGLTEVKEGGKKLIGRHKPENRYLGSLLENTIIQLDSLDKISRLDNAKQYGDTYEEKLFNVALELIITWVNRILFLKLLEAQLITYHKGDKSYSFLNPQLINDYDNLNGLFFQVLAKKPEERNAGVATKFAKVPYLNSSLFEPTELEHNALFISQLQDHVPLELLSSTVIKNTTGKKKTGTIDSLNYFFSFLDAYDFASEGSEDIQEDNKTLINASVLGLIFEKINGYKDGSFFTPSFITMYMCKETIRRAVVQKFNETKYWDCTEFKQLYDKIEDRKEANGIINTLKICDPAVGSGHFLVSALNEIIAIKNDLRVLQDHNGNRLKEYQFEVVNDELMVTDEDGVPFQYNPKNKESQRVQETLFHEKQTIIENCLFGVDINPNSVKICRLRLWIELLKNAYYKPNTNELETLPNIDINIKCGNSLISRFGLDADLKKALKQSKWNIESYKLAVDTYRNAESKEQKREMERLILDIKGNFRSEIGINDPKKIKLEKLKGELFNLTQQTGLFERSKKEQTAWNKRVNVLAVDTKKLDTEIEEIKSNKIYENAFEWRFEFPDVLNDNGDFVGFDVVIGNPPYFVFESTNIGENELNYFKLDNKYKNSQGGKLNAFKLFLSLAPEILKQNGLNCQIFQISFLADNQAKKIREYYLKEQTILKIDAFPERDNENNRVFEEAKMSVCILLSENKKSINTDFELNISHLREINSSPILLNYKIIESIDFETHSIPLANNKEISLLIKIQKDKQKFKNIIKCYQGELNISTHKKYFLNEKNENILIKGAQVQKYFLTQKPSQGNIEYVNKKEYLSENSSPKSNHYSFERIVMQGITGVNEKYRIKASFLDKNSFCGHSCNYFLIDAFSKEEKLELLGLLNSRLYNWLFKTTSTNSNVNSYEIENLPYIKAKNNISKVVDKILFHKSQDAKADTSDLEQQIDMMVYELYGLSAEEINTVENS
ncbi:DNA methyltransferase [Flavobacterium sp. WC2421]|uniref:DUF7149 domain-containing protein n=1 Tax=Flavobacterium sp. WC2421 TaxID=3234138 RepID=UPI0034665159